MQPSIVMLLLVSRTLPVVALARLRSVERLGEVAAARHAACIVVKRPSELVLVHARGVSKHHACDDLPVPV
jgi:hypothetical protein